MYEGYEEKDEVVQLFLDDIIPNRFQPREVFDETALKELAISIKEHGVIQPIIVRSVNGKYEIIAGERRYKASALAGLTKIPAIVRNLDDKESSKVALLENLQRKNLNPIEEARTYQKILELDQMTQEELAKTMGKSQSSVANKIRLLSLPEDIQDAILKEKISERHARALLNVEDQEVQKQLVEKIVSTKMSVIALEDEIKEMYPRGKEASDIPIDVNATASAGEFLDSTPLIPTAGVIQEQTSNYGKVVIAPPKEMQETEPVQEEVSEEVIPTGRIVNYGDIGKNTEENKDIGFNGVALPSTQQSYDVNEIRNKATDIKTTSQSGAALDNLLNISQPVTNPISIEEKQQKEDYFSLPDVNSIKIGEEDLPQNAAQADTPVLGDPIVGNIVIDNPVISNPVIPVPNSQEPMQPLVDIVETPTTTIEEPTMAGPTMEEPIMDTTPAPLIDLTIPSGEPTIAIPNMATPTMEVMPQTASIEEQVEQAADSIKKLVEDLRNQGLRISSDEMNFPKSYQVIIKIEKE